MEESTRDIYLMQSATRTLIENHLLSARIILEGAEKIKTRYPYQHLDGAYELLEKIQEHLLDLGFRNATYTGKVKSSVSRLYSRIDNIDLEAESLRA